MGRQGSLEEAAEGVRRPEHPTGRPHGEETVAIDGLEPDRQSPPRRLDHAGHEEAREVVGDHDRRPGGERLQQAPPRTGLGLDVGIVEDAPMPETAGVVGHSVEHEAVEPVARPRIADPEGLEDQQRLPQLPRAGDRPIEGEAPAGPPGGGHPVDDVRAVRPDGRRADGADPDLRDFGHASTSCTAP
jgi:hypothetical protein